MSKFSLHTFHKLVRPLLSNSNFELDISYTKRIETALLAKVEDTVSNIAKVKNAGFIKTLNDLSAETGNYFTQRFVDHVNEKYGVYNIDDKTFNSTRKLHEVHHTAFGISTTDKFHRTLKVNLNDLLEDFKLKSLNAESQKLGVWDYYALPNKYRSLTANDEKAANVEKFLGFKNELKAGIKKIEESFKEFSYPETLIKASEVRAVFTKEIGVVDVEKLKNTSLKLGKDFDAPAFTALTKLIENYNSEANIKNYISKPVFSALVKEAADNNIFGAYGSSEDSKRYTQHLRAAFTEKAMSAFTLGTEQQKQIAAR